MEGGEQVPQKPRVKRYYKLIQEVTCLGFTKNDGTESKVTKGKTAEGVHLTVIPKGKGAHVIIFEMMQEGKPWPGQREDGTWIAATPK